MHTQTISYTHAGTTFKGFMATANLSIKRPVIIIAHAWRGQDDFARNKAIELAKLGYVGFAADVYGDGKEVQTNEEAAALMTPLFLDRKLLQERINAAYATACQQDCVDQHNVGAIGFCFGGLTVIELFRSGTPIKGAVSFHGVLGNSMGPHKAATVPISKDIKGGLLILHGHDDPLVTANDIQMMQEELTRAKVDWEMVIYGHTSHAFTNPEANDPELGLVFQSKSNQRSWIAMKDFFKEIFPH